MTPSFKYSKCIFTHSRLKQVPWLFFTQSTQCECPIAHCLSLLPHLQYSSFQAIILTVMVHTCCHNLFTPTRHSESLIWVGTSFTTEGVTVWPRKWAFTRSGEAGPQCKSTGRKKRASRSYYIVSDLTKLFSGWDCRPNGKKFSQNCEVYDQAERTLHFGESNFIAVFMSNLLINLCAYCLVTLSTIHVLTLHCIIMVNFCC